MEDVGAAEEPAVSEHFRLIGDLPYILVQFQPDEDDVQIQVSVCGLDVDPSEESIIAALKTVIVALEE